MATRMNEAQRQACVSTNIAVTLDGVPARVTGWRNEYAMVRQSTIGGYGHEWAWETVAYVLTYRNGAFTS